MSDRKKAIIRLSAEAALLLLVSAYRLFSMRYWPWDFLRPYLVWVVYLLLLFDWQRVIHTKITQKRMRVNLTAQNVVSILYMTVRFVQAALLDIKV